MHVGAVAAVDADGCAVHPDGERRTPHGHEVSDVGRGDDVQAVEQRERERVNVAEVKFAPGVWPKDAKPLRYIALRFTRCKRSCSRAARSGTTQ